MANQPKKFRQRDLSAAVKALVNAGQSIARVEVDQNGKLVIYVGDGNLPAEPLTNSYRDYLDAQKRKPRSKFYRSKREPAREQ